LALMIPNLFRRLLGEGQMMAAFLPTFVERIRNGSREEVRRFYSDFLGIFSFVAVVVMCLGYLGAPWLIHTFFASRMTGESGQVELTIRLTQILFPYLAIVSVAAILQAGLQAHRLFWPSTSTPILLNIVVIVTAVLAKDYFPDPSYAFAVGFVLGGVVQVLFQLPFVLRVGLSLMPRLGWRNPQIRRVFRIFLPGVLAGGIYQIDVFVAQMVASTLEQGRISALQYSIRLQELVLGVFVVSMTTVILPSLSEQVAEEGKASPEAGRTLGLSARILALITLPASAGLLLLGPQIIELLFEFGEFTKESSDLVYAALIFHAVGIFPIALSRNVIQGFYAQKDLKTPTIVAGIAAVVHLAMCFWLSGPLDHGGIALAGVLSTLLALSMQVPILHRRGIPVVNRAFLSSLWRVLVACVLMAAWLWWLRALLFTGLPSRAALGFNLLVAIGSGALVYALGLLVVKHPELMRLLHKLRARSR
jgi:putative peptidoglycan lipid II flippase